MATVIPPGLAFTNGRVTSQFEDIPDSRPSIPGARARDSLPTAGGWSGSHGLGPEVVSFTPARPIKDTGRRLSDIPEGELMAAVLGGRPGPGFGRGTAYAHPPHISKTAEFHDLPILQSDGHRVGVNEDGQRGVQKHRIPVRSGDAREPISQIFPPPDQTQSPYPARKIARPCQDAVPEHTPQHKGLRPHNVDDHPKVPMEFGGQPTESTVPTEGTNRHKGLRPHNAEDRPKVPMEFEPDPAAPPSPEQPKDQLQRADQSPQHKGLRPHHVEGRPKVPMEFQSESVVQPHSLEQPVDQSQRSDQSPPPPPQHKGLRPHHVEGRPKIPIEFDPSSPIPEPPVQDQPSSSKPLSSPQHRGLRPHNVTGRAKIPMEYEEPQSQYQPQSRENQRPTRSLTDQGLPAPGPEFTTVQGYQDLGYPTTRTGPAMDQFRMQQAYYADPNQGQAYTNGNMFQPPVQSQNCYYTGQLPMMGQAYPTQAQFLSAGGQHQWGLRTGTFPTEPVKVLDGTNGPPNPTGRRFSAVDIENFAKGEGGPQIEGLDDTNQSSRRNRRG